MPFSIDTRTLRVGDTYVAIQGERYDGHDFVRAAFQKGACAAVVEQHIDGIPHGGKLEIVPDTVLYLTEVARRKIKKSHSKVVAITGSVGKTSTRNAVTQVMRTAGPVVSSPGNLNTLLGLSLTLANSAPEFNTCLVLEMGAGKKGDLDELCRYFKPDISIVTNVRGVHLETLGSIEGVHQEKSALVRALAPSGIACLNADDKYVRAMSEVCKGKCILYGVSADADITPNDVTEKTPLLGEHSIYIVLAAFAAGIAVGISPKVINGVLSRLQPEKGRLNVLPGLGGAILIDDSYNASPDAVHAALNVLCQQSAKRRIAFLGDMLELGAMEVPSHRAVLQKAMEVSDLVYVCGFRMEAGIQNLSKKLKNRVQCFANSTQLAAELARGNVYRPEPGDVILVKGSQGARMERISRALLAEGVPPESALPRQNEAWLAIP